MPLLSAATVVNPKKPAITEIMKNIIAHLITLFSPFVNRSSVLKCCGRETGSSRNTPGPKRPWAIKDQGRHNHRRQRRVWRIPSQATNGLSFYAALAAGHRSGQSHRDPRRLVVAEAIRRLAQLNGIGCSSIGAEPCASAGPRRSASSQGWPTAAGREHARARAQSLTARTEWYVESTSELRTG